MTNAWPGKYLVSVHPNGDVQTKSIEEAPSLEELQGIVGGHIELVPYFNTYDENTCLAFCNTDGKMKDLPVNNPAKELWEKAVGRTITEDYLVGSIAIVIGPIEFLKEM